MMSGWGSRVRAARLLWAAAAAGFPSVPALAQTASPPPPQPAPQPRPAPDAAELDPSAPLAPLPDLGVAWPELNAKEVTPPTAAPSTPTSSPRAVAKSQTSAPPTDAAGNIRYTVAVEGIASVGNAEDLLAQFRKQSALETERKSPSNAAQIGRRASADADLLTQLLRSQGYYDASVDASTDKAGDTLRVILTADPGQQYRFASVELPGLDASGPDSARLRNAFAIKAGDPVIASDVIAGGHQRRRG